MGEPPASGRARPWPALVMLAGGLVALVGLAWWFLEQDGLLWLAAANTWLADNLIARLGYAGVFLLMAVESSFVPFPSEIVMPPAGDLARRFPDWTLGGVILAGVGGSLAGALVNYGLARYLGRTLLLRIIARYGRFLRLSVATYERSESFFLRHGAIATFTGRLIPAVRQLVSLPAGLARMNLIVFCALTGLGAGIWSAVLAVLGYRFGADAALLSETLKRYSLWLVLAALGLIAVYVAVLRWRAGRGAAPPPGGDA